MTEIGAGGAILITAILILGCGRALLRANRRRLAPITVKKKIKAKNLFAAIYAANKLEKAHANSAPLMGPGGPAGPACWCRESRPGGYMGITVIGYPCAQHRKYGVGARTRR